MDRGANQESRWGGIAYGDDMVSVCVSAGRRESIDWGCGCWSVYVKEEVDGLLVCKTCWLLVKGVRG